MPMPMMSDGMYYMNWGMIIGFWLILLFLVSVAAFGFYQGTNRPPGFRAETPIDVLKKRYARGELSDEEFDRMKRTLAA